MFFRKKTEEFERKFLHKRATLSSKTEGREKEENPCRVRMAFQRDRDRIIHSKSFRRLARKTQVFLNPDGDHYRNRLTHTLEVMQISRVIARGLGLNEDLTEAIALGHDLGHTPFGHSGEKVLRRLASKGFHHAKQSLRVVDYVENHGKGLNLTKEVRDGILKHSKGKGPILSDSPKVLPSTLEGQIVRLSDIIAYVNHDIEDAVRANLMQENDIPDEITDVLGKTRSQRIEKAVMSVLKNTDLDAGDNIKMSEEVIEATDSLRDFLYERCYEHPLLRKEFKKTDRIISDLWEYFNEHPFHMYGYGYLFENENKSDVKNKKIDESKLEDLDFKEQMIIDYIAGMTDRFALRCWKDIVLPRSWYV